MIWGHGVFQPLDPQDFIDSSCVQFPTLEARYVVIGELFQSKCVCCLCLD
jgi:hypothetical protein